MLACGALDPATLASVFTCMLAYARAIGDAVCAILGVAETPNGCVGVEVSRVWSCGEPEDDGGSDSSCNKGLNPWGRCGAVSQSWAAFDPQTWRDIAWVDSCR